MSKNSYIKKKVKDSELKELIANRLNKVLQFTFEHKKIISCCIAGLLLFPVLTLPFRHKGINQDLEESSDLIQFANLSNVAASQRNVIAIPSGIVKANPFVPYRDISGTAKVNDIPTFNLVEPPEVINENSEAARVMDTTVSGILYDKYSPSAILNIEGNDYLVKKGDTVNNYKVLNILKDSVTVKLGANVYKAGIGEILTEGSMNRNEVSNLNNKFGGVRQWVTVI